MPRPMPRISAALLADRAMRACRSVMEARYSPSWGDIKVPGCQVVERITMRWPSESTSARKRRDCIETGRYDSRIAEISAYGQQPDLLPARHDRPLSVSSN